MTNQTHIPTTAEAVSAMANSQDQFAQYVASAWRVANLQQREALERGMAGVIDEYRRVARFLAMHQQLQVDARMGFHTACRSMKHHVMVNEGRN